MQDTNVVLIQANQLISSGFCRSDADTMAETLKPLIEQGMNVTIDFRGIRNWSLLFFRTCLIPHLQHLGIEEYNKRIEVINLSMTGGVIYHELVKLVTKKTLLESQVLL